MRFKSVSVLGLLAALLPGVLSAAVPETVAAMYALDRAYIPALGLSGQADQRDKARAAFAAFESEWRAFSARYANDPGFDAAWKGDLERVDAAVRAAGRALAASDGPAAHEALEGVRMTFLESRTRQGIPYYLDSLTRFHGAMEELLAEAPKAASESSGRAGLAAALDAAIARWDEAKASEGLLPAAGLSEKSAAAYREQYAAIASILTGAKAALDAGDGARLSERLGKLKPNFVKAFFLFGDFPG